MLKKDKNCANRLQHIGLTHMFYQICLDVNYISLNTAHLTNIVIITRKLMIVEQQNSFAVWPWSWNLLSCSLSNNILQINLLFAVLLKPDKIHHLWRRWRRSHWTRQTSTVHSDGCFVPLRRRTNWMEANFQVQHMKCDFEGNKMIESVKRCFIRFECVTYVKQFHLVMNILIATKLVMFARRWNIRRFYDSIFTVGVIPY